MGIVGSTLTGSSGSGGGAVTIADGADVTDGAIADSAVTGDNTGTINAHLRGLDKIAADEWDSVNHWVKVHEQSTVAVLNGFSITAYDYVSLAQASTTDTYTFKSGGSGGSTIATITITYTDSTKVTLSTAVKT